MAERSRVLLPSHLTEPFEVYVNGVLQREGLDFHCRGSELEFTRSLRKEGRLGFWRWTSIVFGVAGTYRQNDSVDIVHAVDGRRAVESGLPIEPA